MGTPYTEKYHAFREELERVLRDRCGVDPRILGRNEYPSGSPVQKIHEVMRTCSGIVIVAYEHKRIHSGLEKRGGAEERRITNEVYTTPWNHIESAIAYALNLPIYIIAEQGLMEEGLIESKIDWYVQKMKFDAAELRRLEVCESLRVWVNERVIPLSVRRRPVLQNFIKVKFSELTVEDYMVLFGFVATAFGAGAAFTHFFH
ncbi:hypothetical protein GCM10008941_02760 [Rhizomicrobium palustre]